MSKAAQKRAQAFIELVGEDHINALIKQAQDGVQGIGKKTTKTTKQTKGMKHQWALVATGVNQALELMGKMVGVASKVAEELGKAGSALAIEDEFVRRFEGISNAMGDLEASVSGRATQTFLQKFAAQAQVAGLSFDQIQKTLRISTQLATATGRSMEEVGAKLLKSVVAVTDRALKETLGLNLDMERSIVRYAKSLGKSAETMGLHERRSFMVNKLMEATEAEWGAIATNKGPLHNAQSLEAALGNAGDNIRTKMLPALSSAAEYFGEWAKLIDSQKTDDLQAFAKAVESALSGMQDQAGVSGIELINKSLVDLRVNADDAAAIIRSKLNQQLGQSALQYMSAAKGAELVDNALILYMHQLKELNPALAESIDKQSTAARAAAVLAEAEERAASGTEKAAKAAGVAADNVGRLNVQRHAQATAAAAAMKAEAELLKAMGQQGLAAQLSAEADVLLTKTLPTIFATGHSPLGKGGGRGGGKKKLSEQEMGAKRAADMQKIWNDMFVGIREGAAEAEEAVRLMNEEAAGEATREKVEAILAINRDLAVQQRESLLGAADAMVQFGDSADNMLAKFAGGAMEVAISQIDKFNATIEQFKKAGLGAAKGMQAAVPGAISASGSLFAGMTNDVTAHAAVMGAFELAAAVSATFLNPPLAASKYAGAAMYFAVAGMNAVSGGGGGGGRARASIADRAPSFAADRPQEQKQAKQYHLYMSGATLIGAANSEEVGRDLLDSIEREQRRRTAVNPDFVPG